jgi:hypothetical protein
LQRVHNEEVGESLGRGRLGKTRIARRLVDHPNVVSADLVTFSAFGTPLDAVVAQVGAFSRNRISAITSQLLGGLIAIHQSGAVHADLKASSVLLDAIDWVTIVDFGSARCTPCGDDNVYAGTPAYMAPELFAASPPSIAADIYAAGVIVYELLTGSPPLAPDLPPMLMWSLRVHEAAEAPSLHAPARDISAALDAVLLRALARDPDERFATVRDFADALAGALAAWEPIHDEVTGVFVLPSPEPASLITDALEVAAERLALRDVAGAVKELEAALVRLLAPSEVAAPVIGTAWRIETVLAALYQSTGKTEHAGRMARTAQQHARLTDCPLAEARTTMLLAQLGLGPTRVARGSGQAPLR